MEKAIAENDLEMFREDIKRGIPDELPPAKKRDENVSHAPKRKDILNEEEKRLALKNALRYFDKKHHEELAPEFARELKDYGRIYMYRLMPDYKISARRIDDFPHNSKQAAAIMLMLSNNLDYAVAQH
ncbi:MAG: urocanate hydratase, partial [Bacteroidota bacterium]